MMLHRPDGGTVPAVRLICVPPAGAFSVPPQLLVIAADVAMRRPEGRLSLRVTLSAPIKAVFEIRYVRVEFWNWAIVLGAKAMLRSSGNALTTSEAPTAGVVPSEEVNGPVVLVNPPACRP